jgi:hypothetical protein
MSIRRLISILALVAAVVGVSAIPTVSVARTSAVRQADDTSGDATDTPADGTDTSDDPGTLDDGTDPGSLDDCSGDIVVDDGSGDDPSADDTSGDTGDDGSGDFRQAGAPDDTSTDDTSTDDTSTDDTSTDDGSTDDTSTDDACSASDATDGSGDAKALKNLVKTGGLDQDIDVPGPGTVDGTLESPTGGAASVHAAKAKARILAHGHKHVTKAGRITLRLRLTGLGRRTLRNAKHALHLTLRTKIKLKSGKTIDRSRVVTVQPGKPAGKHKAHKPKH